MKHLNICITFILAGAQTIDHEYDIVEDVPEVSSQDAEGDVENAVIQNPYYDGGDNMDDINEEEKVNIMENPYYGGVENVNDTKNGNDMVNGVENPYYGGIDSESD